MQEESVFDGCNDKYATSQIAYSEKYASSGAALYECCPTGIRLLSLPVLTCFLEV